MLFEPIHFPDLFSCGLALSKTKIAIKMEKISDHEWD